MSYVKTSSERIIKENQIKILSMAEGFIPSCVLFALLKLKVFHRIGKGRNSLNELATDLDVQPETLSRLLNAGVVLKLLESNDGVNYSIAPVYQASLSPSGGEYYIGDLISSFDFFQTALLKLDEAVLNSKPTIDPLSHVGGDKGITSDFILGFHNYASLLGKELAHFVNTADCKSLLDLGCGPGTYAFHLGMRNPSLELYLLDRHEVLEIAKEVQNKYSL